MSQATAEIITVGQLGVRFLVEGPDSSGSVSVFECYVPANARMPAPHSHDAFEETIYGLEGTTSWTVDGESIGESQRSGDNRRVRVDGMGAPISWSVRAAGAGDLS